MLNCYVTDPMVDVTNKDGRAKLSSNKKYEVLEVKFGFHVEILDDLGTRVRIPIQFVRSVD